MRKITTNIPLLRWASQTFKDICRLSNEMDTQKIGDGTRNFIKISRNKAEDREKKCKYHRS